MRQPDMVSESKSDHRRLAQRHTRCYIKSCEITQSISEELLCPEQR
jgi:hypothetical protein